MASAVLFDLDGTLFDTAPDFIYLVNELRAEHNLPAIDSIEFKPIISRGSAAMLQYALNITDKDPKYAAILEYFYQQYYEKMGTYSNFFPGIPEVLTELDQRNIPWGVVTNRIEKNIPTYLERFNLLERVHCIVGADTTPHRKPHPAPLIHAAKELNVPRKETIYVGDYPTDLQAAHSANMIPVAAAWGYCESLENLLEKKPAYVLNHPLEILTII